MLGVTSALPASVSPSSRLVAIWAVLVGAALPSMAPAQVEAGRRDSIIWVLSLYDSSWFWLSYQSARLAVQEFGSDAGVVAVELLEHPRATSQTRHRVLGALRVAAYEASGFPISRLRELASGRDTVHADRNVNYGFRLAALRALASRPRAELAEYWTPLLSDQYTEVRQAAASGLACALGPAALDTLAYIVGADPHADVRNTAAYAVRQLTEAGDSARVCLYGTWTRHQAASPEVPLDSGLVAKARRHFGFRR